MDAFTQLKVARRLSPAMSTVMGLLKPENKDKNKDVLTLLMFAYVNEDDMLMIVHECLGVVGRKQESGIAKIRKDGVTMFDDITMPDMLKLTVAVIEENLGDFFRTSLAGVEQQKAATLQP